MSAGFGRAKDLNLVDHVNGLNEEVKALALNLAIYLAKAKGHNEQLTRLEPDFIRLVNGTVKVVHELALVINAARNLDQSRSAIQTNNAPSEQLEIRLRSILDQCNRIINSLSRTGKLSM